MESMIVHQNYLKISPCGDGLTGGRVSRMVGFRGSISEISNRKVVGFRERSGFANIYCTAPTQTDRGVIGDGGRAPARATVMTFVTTLRL